MPQHRTIAVAILLLGLGGAALLGAVLYGAVVVSAHRLPRAHAAIEADWAMIQAWLPPPAAPGPSDPTLDRVVQPLLEDDATVEDADALALWLADGRSVPAAGCTSPSPDAPPPQPSVLELYRAGEALIEHGHPEAALELADQLRAGPILQLMVSEALVQQVRPEHRGPAEDLFAALTSEIACSEAMLQVLGPDDLGELPDGFVIDLETERWKARDWWARLLLALHPVRHDRDALRAVVEGFEPPADDALIGRLFATATLNVASEYLEPR